MLLDGTVVDDLNIIEVDGLFASLLLILRFKVANLLLSLCALDSASASALLGVRSVLRETLFLEQLKLGNAVLVHEAIFLVFAH